MHVFFRIFFFIYIYCMLENILREYISLTGDVSLYVVSRFATKSDGLTLSLQYCYRYQEYVNTHKSVPFNTVVIAAEYD